MAQLAAPSSELAQRLLAEQPWEGRLTGYWTNLMSGSIQHYIYNLPQAADFLHGTVEILYERNGSVGYVNVADLLAWVRDTLQDAELAQAVSVFAEELAACPDDVKRQRKEIEIIEPLGELLRARYKQCVAVLGADSKVKEKTL